MAKRYLSVIIPWAKEHRSKAQNAERMRTSRALRKAQREASRPLSCNSCQQPIRAQLAGWDWSWCCQACGAAGIKPADGSTWDARRNAASQKVLKSMGYVPKKRGK